MIKNFKRNVLDIDDVLKVIKIIIKENNDDNKVVTLSNKFNIEPMDIVKIFEKKMNKLGRYKIKKVKKQIWTLNYEKNAYYFKKAKIRFNRNYLSKTISKYY